MAEQNVGKVVEVKGVVIDVVFTGELPQINNALRSRSRAQTETAAST